MALHMTRTGVALTVGIILLTGLVIAGLFIVKNSGEQARRDEAINIAEQNLESQSGNDVALNEGNKDKNAESDKNSDSSTSNSEAANGSAAGSNSESESNSGSSSAVNESQSSELPQTGPNDPSTLLVVGILALSVTSYLASRRQILG